MFSKITNEVPIKIFADYALHNDVDLYNVCDVNI